MKTAAFPKPPFVLRAAAAAFVVVVKHYAPTPGIDVVGADDAAAGCPDAAAAIIDTVGMFGKYLVRTLSALHPLTLSSFHPFTLFRPFTLLYT